MEPLTLWACDENFNKKAMEYYSAMLNPESVKWNRRIEYNDEQGPGTSATSQKYKFTPNDELSFEMVIDCTGVVDSGRTDMFREIADLERVVYNYNGGIHRPNFVKLEWGKLVFNSVLKSFDTTYTLFKPDGSPLRARVSLSFGEYITPKQRKKKEQQQSPDVSHLVSVTEGDTLPQLCEKVWQSPEMYIQVARFNGLNKFRQLIGGQTLTFPPIQSSIL